MTYIKGGLLLLAILAFVLLAETMYNRRQELQNADLYVAQNMEKFAQSSVEEFDNMQSNFNHAVEDAERTYTEELGL